MEEAQGAIHGARNEDGFGEGHQAVHVAGFVVIIPTDEFIFFRGVGIPPTRLLAI